MDELKKPVNGVLAGAQAVLFESLGEAEESLFCEAAPFRSKPTPVGGSRKGRPNRRTIVMRELYLKMGLPHPMLFDGQLLALGVDGLAWELAGGEEAFRLLERAGQIDLRVEAAKILQRASDSVKPYLESKMPTAIVATDDKGTPVLVIGQVGAPGARTIEQREDGAMAIDDDLYEAIEAQDKSTT